MLLTPAQILGFVVLISGSGHVNVFFRDSCCSFTHARRVLVACLFRLVERIFVDESTPTVSHIQGLCCLVACSVWLRPFLSMKFNTCKECISWLLVLVVSLVETFFVDESITE